MRLTGKARKWEQPPGPRNYHAPLCPTVSCRRCTASSTVHLPAWMPVGSSCGCGREGTQSRTVASSSRHWPHTVARRGEHSSTHSSMGCQRRLRTNSWPGTFQMSWTRLSLWQSVSTLGWRIADDWSNPDLHLSSNADDLPATPRFRNLSPAPLLTPPPRASRRPWW